MTKTPFISIALRATFLALFGVIAYSSAPTAFAQYAGYGSCGGRVASGFMCPEETYTYQQCSSTQRPQFSGTQSNSCPSNPNDYYSSSEFGVCREDSTCSTPLTASVSVNPSSIVRGNSAVLSWSSSGATSGCTANGFSTGGASSGSVSVAPSETTAYSLTCSTPLHSASGGATLTVSNPPLAASCYANKSSAAVGENVTWYASASNGISPYYYTWVGQLIDGFTGSSANVAYTTPGQKTASIEVRDSATNGAGMSVYQHSSSRCTGTLIASDVGGSQEDGGTPENAERMAQSYADGVFYGAYGVHYNQGYRATFDAVVANPQNYCTETKLTQLCDNGSYGSGAGNGTWNGCNFIHRVNIYSGSGYRGLQSSDFGDYAGGWDRTRTYVTATGMRSAGSPSSTVQSCTTTVNVAASAPTAALTANPVSITAGGSSTLTWSSTNATSCTGTNFSTGGATSGSVAVSPGSTTNYSLSCTGSGGNASASATVTVSAAVAQPNYVGTVGGNVYGTVGQPVTLTGTVSNIGGGGAYIPNIFSIANVGLLDAGYTTVNAGQGGVYRSASYTFYSAGTYYFNMCANTDTGGGHPSPETNIYDDCGSQGSITISPGQTSGPPSAPTGLTYACSADATYATLSWTGPSNASFYYLRTINNDSCKSGWNPIPGAEWACEPNGGGRVYGNSVIKYINPNTTVQWWMHSANSYGYSDPQTNGVSFSCSPQSQSKPPSPSLSYTCSADGTQAYMSWSSSPGAQFYRVRVQKNDGYCRSGWLQDPNVPSVCDASSYGNPNPNDNVYGTSYTLPVNPGTSYQWWVHAQNAAGFSDPPTYGNITCNAAANPDLTAGGIYPATASLNTSVQFASTQTNIGQATSGYFSSVFQVDYGGYQAATYWLPQLGPGQSYPAVFNYTFTTPGNHVIRSCANMNTSGTNITPEGNYGNNCGPWTNIYVDAGPQPDLTASSVYPTTATAGQQVQLFSNNTNSGNATSGYFQSVFQFDYGSFQAARYGMPQLGAGQSYPAEILYTFPSAGSYQVRSCANMNTSGTNITTESNYGNNCGPYTTITVSNPAPQPLSCYVTPTSLNQGESATYYASGGGAPYTWSASDGYSMGTGSAVSRPFNAPGSYGMTLSKPGYVSANCSLVTAAGNTCTGSPSVSITASPTRVRSGNTATLSWSATNVPGASPSCTISGPGVNQTVAAGAAPSCSIPSSSATPTITQQSTYTITCGSTSATAVVNVIPQFEEF